MSETTSNPVQPIAGAHAGIGSSNRSAITPHSQPPGFVPATPPPHWSSPPIAKRPGFGYGFGKGAGFGVGFGAVLTIGIIVGSLVFAVGLAAMVPSSTASTRYATVWGSTTAPNTVRAVVISGTIRAGSIDGTTSLGGTYGYEIAD
jgi:protease-4